MELGNQAGWIPDHPSFSVMGKNRSVLIPPEGLHATDKLKLK